MISKMKVPKLVVNSLKLLTVSTENFNFRCSSISRSKHSSEQMCWFNPKQRYSVNAMVDLFSLILISACENYSDWSSVQILANLIRLKRKMNKEKNPHDKN